MPTFLISSAVALGRMGRRTEAFARMEEVLGLLRPEDFAGHMRALEALGELHEADLQNEAAEARYREALDRLQPDAGQGDEWRPRMLLNLAAVLRSEGRLPEARAAAREARGILELARQAIRGEGSRLQYSARLDEASDIEVDVLMGMHEQDPRGGWERAALERTEESRGRVLRELLWEPATRPGSPAKAEVLAKAQEIRERLNAETSRQLRLSQSDVGGAAESVVKLSQLIAEYQEVRAETRAHRAREAEPRPFRVPDLQALVDADTTALVYDLGKARSHVWVLTSRSVASHVLPGRDHIEPLVAQLRTLVARERAGGNESSSDYDRLASHLSKTLLASLGPRPAGHRLVVIGDGALDTLPFAALPLPERWRSDAEAADSSRPLLMNAFEIVRLPSLSIVAALRRRHAGPPPPPAGSLAIIADPVFSHDDPRLRKLGPAPAAAGAMNAGADLPRLYLTRGLADLARDAPDRELGAFDFEASLGTVRSRGLAGYRTVIFATHALVNPQVPELSGLVLSLFDADAAPRNGVLTLQDVHDLDLHAELVVLAGCDTAMGKQIHGEGLITLSRGFLYAGARRVLATLWEVDEEATVALIKAFYGLVQRGHSHADALRRAQASLAENPRWRSPYYWAGFVLQGDWK
jgi:CHAT domain-containing protein